MINKERWIYRNIMKNNNTSRLTKSKYQILITFDSIVTINIDIAGT